MSPVTAACHSLASKTCVKQTHASTVLISAPGWQHAPWAQPLSALLSYLSQPLMTGGLPSYIPCCQQHHLGACTLQQMTDMVTRQRILRVAEAPRRSVAGGTVSRTSEHELHSKKWCAVVAPIALHRVNPHAADHTNKASPKHHPTAGHATSTRRTPPPSFLLARLRRTSSGPANTSGSITWCQSL